MRLRLVGPALLALSAPLAGQQSPLRVIVTDSLGQRIPFAVVQLRDGLSRAANESGVVLLEASSKDSLRVVVRRMGFSPAEAWAPAGNGTREVTVMMARLPQFVNEQTIRAPKDNRLARRGFYERMGEFQKLTTKARFFSPEELDQRNALRVSSVLESVTFLSVRKTAEVADRPLPRLVSVITGRGRCVATILLDGEVLRGTYEHYMAENRPASSPMNAPTPLDEMILPTSIAAIEVYATASGAPGALRVKAFQSSCPLVAIWTGPRQ